MREESPSKDNPGSKQSSIVDVKILQKTPREENLEEKIKIEEEMY